MREVQSCNGDFVLAPACTPVLSCLHLSVTQAQVRKHGGTAGKGAIMQVKTIRGLYLLIRCRAFVLAHR